MKNKNVNKIILYFKLCSDETKMIIIYRYVSLFITSLFYFFYDFNISIYNKIFIIACISISSVILNYLYINNDKSDLNIKLLILIEIVGNSFILAPSGGINSPYVWYSLNTILITTFKVNKKYFCWIILFLYFTVSTVAYYAFDRNKGNLFNIINEKSNIILSLILITLAVQVISKGFKKIQENYNELNESNKKLLAANIKVKERINYVIDLYQAIHLFTTQNDKGSIIDNIMTCTKKITNTNIVLFYDYLKHENNIIIKANNLSQEMYKQIKEIVLEISNSKTYYEQPVQVKICDKSLILVLIKSTYQTYGILAVEACTDKEASQYRETFEQMTFLSELSSMVLEKFEVEKIKDRFMIIEEQNRIANEIHDSVIQRLFTTSVGIYKIRKSYKDASLEEIDEALKRTQNTIDSIMRELRYTIYSLSSEKNYEKNFESNIKKYIDEIRQLNDVEFILNIKSIPEQLSVLHKKAFYRIICESIGNAVRHGQASKIKIDFNIIDDVALLKIDDNGTGFNIKKINNSKIGGLGVKNIQILVQLMKGEVIIDSKIRKGTVISVKVPNIYQR